MSNIFNRVSFISEAVFILLIQNFPEKTNEIILSLIRIKNKYPNIKTVLGPILDELIQMPKKIEDLIYTEFDGFNQLTTLLTRKNVVYFICIFLNMIDTIKTYTEAIHNKLIKINDIIFKKINNFSNFDGKYAIKLLILNIKLDNKNIKFLSQCIHTIMKFMVTAIKEKKIKEEDLQNFNIIVSKMQVPIIHYCIDIIHQQKISNYDVQITENFLLIENMLLSILDHDIDDIDNINICNYKFTTGDIVDCIDETYYKNMKYIIKLKYTLNSYLDYDTRSKYLNNLALLIIGIKNDQVQCSFLYPWRIKKLNKIKDTKLLEKKEIRLSRFINKLKKCCNNFQLPCSAIAKWHPMTVKDWAKHDNYLYINPKNPINNMKPFEITKDGKLVNRKNIKQYIAQRQSFYGLVPLNTIIEELPTYITFAHGSELDTLPIQLNANEYVIMNCNPFTLSYSVSVLVEVKLVYDTPTGKFNKLK